MVSISEEQYKEYLSLKRRREIEDYAQTFWKKYTSIIFKEFLQNTAAAIIFLDRYEISRAYDKDTLGESCKIRAVSEKVRIIYAQVVIHENRDIEDIKRTIRHELIHYSLQLMNLKSDDNSAVFKILCDLFDGKFYGEMDSLELEIYKMGFELFNKTLNQDNLEMARDLGYYLNVSMLLGVIGDEKYDSIDKLKELHEGITVIEEAMCIQKKTNRL